MGRKEFLRVMPGTGREKSKSNCNIFFFKTSEEVFMPRSMLCEKREKGYLYRNQKGYIQNKQIFMSYNTMPYQK